MSDKLYTCPKCKRRIPYCRIIEGVCPTCEKDGYWMDPAGTLQQGEDEPWRAYE